MLSGCAQPVIHEADAAGTSAMCDVFGFQRGTEAYGQCAAKVTEAQWREARSARARVNCTPMGDQTICQ